ncbi:hypothetical protein MKW98_026068 [Papaver atlanticum]|uniref:Uncharacterized protein n=1 Tax=Papaver atlanticum TaxID=357466 RepID=A0AAD4RY01_9MAGN|nr:hypothetical protein MKW98_026068 [Papaver atlanticum]
MMDILEKLLIGKKKPFSLLLGSIRRVLDKEGIRLDVGIISDDAVDMAGGDMVCTSVDISDVVLIWLLSFWGSSVKVKRIKKILGFQKTYRLHREREREMAWRLAGSLSRSLLSTARASSVRSSPTLTRLRPSQLPTSTHRTRRFSFVNPRTLGELGCTQSILPPVAACHFSPHLSLNARDFCGVFQGNGKDG